jgi:hypothetical protein
MDEQHGPQQKTTIDEQHDPNKNYNRWATRTQPKTTMDEQHGPQQKTTIDQQHEPNQKL